MAGTGLASGVKTILGGEKAAKPSTINQAAATDLITDHKIPLVTDLGDVTASANTIGFNVYGEGTQRNIAGFANLEEWTFTVALDESNAAHTALMDSDVGDHWNFTIQTKTGASAITDVFIHGELGGKAIQTPTDGPRALEVTVTLAESAKVFRA